MKDILPKKGMKLLLFRLSGHNIFPEIHIEYSNEQLELPLNTYIVN